VRYRLGMESAERSARAIARIDDANAVDPSVVVDATGERVAKELLYARRMSARLDALEPGASEALRLAVRAQHIERWKIPRSAYPDGVLGYKKWRAELGRFHAETAAAILRDVGYDDAVIDRVRALVQKRGLGRDASAEVQVLEDVACLVFLEHYLADFAAKHTDDKLVDIVKKTWAKMSDRARAVARGLALGEQQRQIVARAVGASE